MQTNSTEIITEITLGHDNMGQLSNHDFWETRVHLQTAEIGYKSKS